jgi:ERCC4-related helicase
MEDREYQSAIAATAIRQNTLVVLPTGLGKTAIALRVMAEMLLQHPTQSLLVLAPTRPLVVQHARSVSEFLLAPPPVVLTGTTAPDERTDSWIPQKIVVATPQVVVHDLAAGRLSLDSLSLIVFDEAHRAVKDYPYVAIGQAVGSRPIRILAMTASPGSRIERVREVWHHLHIEKFEFRADTDPDVLRYSHAVQVDTVLVPVPVEVRHLAMRLQTVVARHLQTLQRLGHLGASAASRTDLLRIGEVLDQQIARARARKETTVGVLWQARSAQAMAMKAMHAVELAETQGTDALRQYLQRQTVASLGRGGALRGFAADPDVLEVRRQLETLDLEHPKIETAVRIVQEELKSHPAGRVLVFAQYRQTGEALVAAMRRTAPEIRVARFFGQASHDKDPGLSQREQIALLDQFRSGALNCLVATSVAEEGLDIPSTDLVVFYEPVPDEIRTIQRRGRTGRARTGRAIVLIASGTRDVSMNRAAASRERKMKELLERVEEESRHGNLLTPHPPSVQRQIDEFE